MSYCRWGQDSDVYIFLGEDGLHCCGCRLNGRRGEEFITDMYSEMLSHLDHHKAAGQKVDASALQELAEEARVFNDRTSNWLPNQPTSENKQEG